MKSGLTCSRQSSSTLTPANDTTLHLGSWNLQRTERMDYMDDLSRRKRSYETHTLDPTAHGYPVHMIAPTSSYQWDEMDYTSPAIGVHQFAPTSAPIQYNASAMMTFSPVDYARQDISYTAAYSENNGAASVQTSTLYHVGPFRYSELANMDGDTSSVSQESIYSRSTRLHSLTDSERRDSQTHSILSNSDVRRESDSFERATTLSTIDKERYRADACSLDSPRRDMCSSSSKKDCASTTGLANSQYNTSRPLPSQSTSREINSPEFANNSKSANQTVFTFQESTTTEDMKAIKPKRMPRSKSAQSSISDDQTQEKASKLRARQAHSLVERKYRDNLNLKISQLHQTLQCAHFGPASCSRSPLKEFKTEYFDEESVVSPEMSTEKSSTGSTPTGPKVRKSDVLTEAMDYVKATEYEMKQMSEEILRLQARVRTLEKLIRCEDCSLLKQMVTL